MQESPADATSRKKCDRKRVKPLPLSFLDRLVASYKQIKKKNILVGVYLDSQQEPDGLRRLQILCRRHPSKRPLVPS